MKKFLFVAVLLAMVVGLVGCNGAQYHLKEFTLVNNKPILTRQIDATYDILNANVSDKLLFVDVQNGVVIIQGRVYKADPNSGYAEAEMIRAGMSFGQDKTANGLIDKITKMFSRKTIPDANGTSEVKK